jgi:hypothetical protein
MNPENKKSLLDIVKGNKNKYKRWNFFRPSIDKNYKDLYNAVESGELSMQTIPEKDWKSHLANNKNLTNKNLSGYYTPNLKTGAGNITVPENASNQTVGHEVLHYFSGHKENGRNVPKINPYIKADIALKGWLPSLHPAGRRPTLKGNNPIFNFWNKKIATKNAEYSNKEGYHPWYDESAFDKFSDVNSSTDPLKQAMTNKISINEKPISIDKNNYPTYNKESNKAQDFRTAFRNARKSGKSNFNWNDRDYTTKLK